MKYAFVFSILIICWLLSGCRGAPDEEIFTTPLPIHEESTPINTAKPSPNTKNPTITPQPSRTFEPTAIEICSPLEGYTYPDLAAAIVNPYVPPPPGYDRPHQGIDLAVIDEATGLAVSGEWVHAVIGGEVTMVISDRFPYGNAILVKTSVQKIEDLVVILHPIPTPWVDVTPDPALTCPDYRGTALPGERMAIYILYAHLDEIPSTPVGTEIRCGEAIGKIGMSGNALNPHVHIEARLGPNGAVFDSMAHYDSSATIKEMGAYCQWRVSGIFQHFDPILLLQGLPVSP